MIDVYHDICVAERRQKIPKLSSVISACLVMIIIIIGKFVSLVKIEPRDSIFILII